MTFQRYLPATFLASFSKSIMEPRPDSVIAVGDRVSGKVYTSAVGRVAGINGFYDAHSIKIKDFVDGLWTKYEGYLASAMVVSSAVTFPLWTGQWC